MLQCHPVFACGSSIAGTVSFLEEAEFDEVMMVPSSSSGKGWACATTGVDQDNFGHGRWTRMVDVPHVGEESILSDIEDEQ